MGINFGKKYSHLTHGFGCLCQSPLVAEINARLNGGMSRRSVLRGIAGAVGTMAVGLPAFAADGKPVLLKNVKVFDGKSAAYLEGRDVLVSGNRIEDLVGQGETVADAEIIDCGGRTLMPGLIDAHWHTILAGINQVAAMTADVAYVHLVAAQEAERTLMRGFTTVRDVGGPSFALKRAIDEGRMAGPRIYPSGAMISQTSGHGDFRMRTDLPRSTQSNLSATEVSGISALADGVPEVLRRAREQLMLGASQLKIMAGGGVTSVFDPLDSLQFTEAEMRAAVDAASDWGTYVCAHVYTSAGIRRALDCGVKSIEHGQLADEDTVRRMADAGVWWSLQPFLADEDSNPGSTPEQQQKRLEVSQGTVRAFELGKKHGVNMAWGTDILFNPKGTAAQGRHLAKIARWFDNHEVLSLATGRNAELLALSGPRNPYQGKLGVIEAGAMADLLVVEGDPLQDISVVADPDNTMKLIMKDGRIHKNTLGA
ncbi:metal-dependent hydrolase family protein [Aquamicrobium terrae]|uniref:Imidazolonepropionase-like amidohydrolase n=1 Tax=Aquamicrobium terrae TaxID=1324945 RepID=A0ABV2N478_9HYPH